MTDDQIRDQMETVREVIEDVECPTISEAVRRTWAKCAIDWLQEIVDELDRRIGKDC